MSHNCIHDAVACSTCCQDSQPASTCQITSAPCGEVGSFRSVADITSPESLAKVREFKKAAKAAAKGCELRAAG